MNQEEKIYKTSEKLAALSKSLEFNFVYQILVAIIYLIYLVGEIQAEEEISLFGLKFDIAIFVILFPIILLFFLSRMAVLNMVFIEFAEIFYKDVRSGGEKMVNYFNAFRPTSVFLSIPLSRNSLNKRKNFIQKLISIVLFVIPGFNMALVLYSIITYQNIWLIAFLMVLTVLVFGLLFHEFNKGVYTRFYKHLMWSAFSSMVIFLTLFLIFVPKLNTALQPPIERIGEKNEPISEKEFHHLMQNIAQSWSAQSADSALRSFDEDAIYMEPPNVQYYQGHEQLRRYFDALESCTKMEFHNLWFNENTQSGVGEFTFSYGKDTSDVGTAVVEIKNGKIVFWREYHRKGPTDFKEFLRVEDKVWEWHIGNHP